MYDPSDPPPEELTNTRVIGVNYAREMRKWNGPYTFQRWPAMLYMARQLPSGKWATSMDEPPSFGYTKDQDWNRACQAAENFTRNCQRIVTEQEYERAYQEGWRDSPQEALAYRGALEKAVSDAASHRHFEDQRLSPKAKAEANAADAASFEHLPEIPEKRKRGRPRKSAPAA